MLYVLIFLSGVSSLIFEITWIRSLGLWFGTSTPAISTVLAAFMGGLALGNLVIGPRADRHPEPMRLYRSLELGIGASGLTVSLLLLHGDPAMAAMGRLVAAAPAGGLVRFLLFAGLMLVPAALMGGTLPVIARALVRGGRSGQVLGWLYAVNTAGALVGALLPDFLLFRTLGMTPAVLIAAGLNLCVALMAGRIPVAAPPPKPATFGRSANATALLLFAVSGFCAMGYEVVWARVIAHWSLSWVTSFSVLLATFLAMVALGSRVASRFADRSQAPLAVAALLLALTGLAAFLPIALAPQGKELLELILPRQADAGRAGFGYMTVRALLCSLYLEGAACLLMGAAFPFLAAAAVPEGDAGRASGQLVAANTLAAVLGSVTVGFLLLPALGAQRTLWLLSLAAGAVGIAASARARSRVLLAAGATGVTLLSGLALDDSHLIHASFPRPAEDFVAVREGPVSTIAAVDEYRHGQLLARELVTPGVSMSDTGFAARRYMGMMGHLPLFLLDGAEDALLICYGVGNTARSLLSHPDLKRLHVVDISPEVLALSPVFAEVAGSDPLTDPRTTVFVEDGRYHLLTSGHRYDVITSEPPPPHNAGVVNLYSQEYYATAKAQLKPGGVVAQWFPVFQLSQAEISSLLAPFLAEFPHTAMFYGFADQWIMVGSEAPLQARLADWADRGATPQVSADLAHSGFAGPSELLGSFMQTDAGLRAAAGLARPVTDDFPSIQYPTDRITASDVPAGVVGSTLGVVEIIAPPSSRPLEALHELPGLRASLEAGNVVLRTLPLMHLQPPAWRELVYGTALREALHHRPGDPGILGLLHLSPDDVAAAERGWAADEDPLAALQLARSAFYTGRYALALEWLGQAEPASVGPAWYWLIDGGSRRALGQPSADSFRKGAAAAEHNELRTTLGLMAQGSEAPWPPHKGPLAGPD